MFSPSEMLRKYNKNGWCATETKHLPSHVKEGIRLAGFRPLMKQCFGNSQKICVLQRKHSFTYCEGIVESDSIKGYYLDHAWIMDVDGFHYDLTLNPAPKVIAHKEYTVEDINNNLRKTNLWCPINQIWLNYVQFALNFDIDFNCSEEELIKKVDKHRNDLYEEMERVRIEQEKNN